MSEQVLVIPTAVFHSVGLFQGLSLDVASYLPQLLKQEHLQFLPREEAENDPTFKQLIPYLVLCQNGKVFHYRRRGGSERRLQAKRSIGLGGHISSEDGPANVAYRAGMARELAEETEGAMVISERCVALINDDSTPVGQVHLGIVHVLHVRGEVHLRESELLGGGFAEPAELLGDMAQFETWSQLLLTSGQWATWQDGQP
jgi:predicted NUDIX family phosphoesterase